ncbi:MAG: HAD-IIA family hydrolase [Dermatophilaceae bacterium]
MTDDAVRRLRAARGFVLDMDGTLAVGDHLTSRMRPLPGAVDLVNLLRTRDIPLVVFTNGTNKSSARYAAALRAAGLPVAAREVLTPLDIVVDICRRRRHRRVMVLAAGSAAATLRQVGVEVLAAKGRPAQVDAVVVGWFPQLRYEHLEAACHALESGARLYSASMSPYYATAKGRTLATSRAIAAGLRSITGARIEVVGKPSAVAMRAAARRVGRRPPEIAVVGDDPELEVPMARRSGAVAVAVLTGIATEADFAAQPAALRRDLVFPTVAEMVAVLDGHRPDESRS